jgi:peptide/nickel transport system permease protein
MRGYLVRRALLFVPALVGVSFVIFVAVRLVPGDIAEILVLESGTEFRDAQEARIERIRQELGLDRPMPVQFVDWLARAVGGDFGYSYIEQRPVVRILWERFPRSLELALLTITISVLLAIPLGVAAAVRHGTWVDRLVLMISVAGLSVPTFVMGVLLLHGLVRLFGWLPSLEFVGFFDDPVGNLKLVAWPAMIQALYVSAPIARLTRAQMLGAIHEEYARTARAKGLGPWCVVYRHALRNSLLPVITFVGSWGGRLLGGVVVMETIFVIPGMGTALVQAASTRDYPTIQAIVLVMAATSLSLSLALDVLYAWLDPRIRYA